MAYKSLCETSLYVLPSVLEHPVPQLIILQDAVHDLILYELSGPVNCEASST